jgi:beta-glucosidase
MGDQLRRRGHDAEMSRIETDAEEAVRPLSGADWWTTPAAAGVPAIKVTDGPSGARGELFVGGPPSVWFPCGAAVGATWDTELIARMGAALADETRAKGAHVLLGPTVNLQRDPLGGRHFECLSEDPYLTARLAVAYVRALQAGGVAACVKHLVANDAEDDRFEVSSDVDERTLREVSLLPFEHALREAGAWSVMSAYNRLNGTHCSEHRWLLTRVLREEWGWDGAVISDWFGTRSTVAAALAGLDLEMPGPGIHFGAALADAVRDDAVPLQVLQEKHGHLRLLADRTGATTTAPGAEGPGGGAAVEVARDVAANAAVLLKNEGGVLPLDPAGVRRVAVIGPNADREVVGGGGSARLTPTAVSTVRDGLKARFGHRDVEYAQGCGADRGTPALDGRRVRRGDGTPGVDVEVVDGDGDVRLALRPRGFNVLMASSPWPGAPAGGWSVRASCLYEPERTGVHRFKVKTNGVGRLTVGGEVVVDTAGGAPEGTTELVAGVPVRVEVAAGPAPGGADVFRFALELRCAPPAPEDGIAEAAALAAGADDAVVVVGTDGEWETEGRDRDDLSLPGAQVELIRAVAAAQPRTAVVVLAGSPVDLSWVDEVPALLWGWFPGEEGGEALADVLTGERDAAGRLPCTMPASLGDTLAAVAERGSGHVRYEEGVFAGHRRYDRDGIEPAFPFGFGLSYTTFAIGPPVASASSVGPGEGVSVEVPVTNTGPRRGVETVQLYVRDVDAGVERPARELRGFAKVALAPGATGTATIALGPRDLAFWDGDARCWRAEAGTFELVAARSSRHPAGSTTVELTDDWTAPPSSPPA